MGSQRVGHDWVTNTHIYILKICALCCTAWILPLRLSFSLVLIFFWAGPQDEEYMELISWYPVGHWETKVQADLLITEGSTTSSDGEGLLYRQQCPHLQAFTAVTPTWTAGTAPLVKAAVTLARSQLFLIYTSTEDFTTGVEKKDEGYFGVAKETSSWSPLLLKTAVHKKVNVYMPFSTRLLNHLRLKTGTRQIECKCWPHYW